MKGESAVLSLPVTSCESAFLYLSTHSRSLITFLMMTAGLCFSGTASSISLLSLITLKKVSVRVWSSRKNGNPWSARKEAAAAMEASMSNAMERCGSSLGDFPWSMPGGLSASQTLFPPKLLGSSMGTLRWSLRCRPTTLVFKRTRSFQIQITIPARRWKGHVLRLGDAGALARHTDIGSMLEDIIASNIFNRGAQPRLARYRENLSRFVLHPSQSG